MTTGLSVGFGVSVSFGVSLGFCVGLGAAVLSGRSVADGFCVGSGFLVPLGRFSGVWLCSEFSVEASATLWSAGLLVGSGFFGVLVGLLLGEAFAVGLAVAVAFAEGSAEADALGDTDGEGDGFGALEQPAIPSPKDMAKIMASDFFMIMAPNGNFHKDLVPERLRAREKSEKHAWCCRSRG
ncbi:MAG: hypothetical protein ACLTU3_03680 [Acutalibacteraceae bacterium]